MTVLVEVLDRETKVHVPGRIIKLKHSSYIQYYDELSDVLANAEVVERCKVVGDNVFAGLALAIALDTFEHVEFSRETPSKPRQI